jgi:hypothetical protein
MQEEESVQAIQHGVRLAAVALAHDQGRDFASLTELQPDDEKEAAELREALAQVQGVLLGSAPRAEIPRHLYDFIASSRNATHPLLRTTHGWSFEGAHATELRRVGTDWAVVETSSTEPGAWISIMTDAVVPSSGAEGPMEGTIDNTKGAPIGAGYRDRDGW